MTHQLHDPLQDSTPLPRYITKRDADRRAARAFWRGIGIGVLIGVAMGLSLPAVWP
jgi:Mg/Co/Ni transporter MgtE